MSDIEKNISELRAMLQEIRDESRRIEQQLTDKTPPVKGMPNKKATAKDVKAYLEAAQKLNPYITMRMDIAAGNQRQNYYTFGDKALGEDIIEVHSSREACAFLCGVLYGLGREG
jgi:N6-adenosine-specific RNA methylase IME4